MLRYSRPNQALCSIITRYVTVALQTANGLHRNARSLYDENKAILLFSLFGMAMGIATSTTVLVTRPLFPA